jgi:hypothetical protein
LAQPEAVQSCLELSVGQLSQTFRVLASAHAIYLHLFRKTKLTQSCQERKGNERPG